MAEYTFDKHMMAGGRLDIAKAFNAGELAEPFAVLMDSNFRTERALYEYGFIEDWAISVHTSSPKKAPASTPTEFVCRVPVAYDGQGLKTGELYVDVFETEDGLRPMSNFYSYFPAGTQLRMADDFWHINSRGDYEYDGERFTFTEDTESFTIIWQDDIPGDKGEIVTGFVVRTSPHTEDPR